MDLDREREALRDALARVARGDASALKEVYERTSAKLFGICLRILGERSEAEDVLQEVYIAVWRGAHGFDAGRGSPIEPPPSHRWPPRRRVWPLSFSGQRPGRPRRPGPAP